MVHIESSFTQHKAEGRFGGLPGLAWPGLAWLLDPLASNNFSSFCFVYLILATGRAPTLYKLLQSPRLSLEIFEVSPASQTKPRM